MQSLIPGKSTIFWISKLKSRVKYRVAFDESTLVLLLCDLAVSLRLIVAMGEVSEDCFRIPMWAQFLLCVFSLLHQRASCICFKAYWVNRPVCLLDFYSQFINPPALGV